MDKIAYLGVISAAVIAVILAIMFMFSRVYKRSTKNYAFVRTGAGGAKVIKDGGTLVLPVLHDVIQVNMNTMKLNISKQKAEALITLDRMRVDVSADFYVRVKQDVKAIENAAQTLGSKTLDPEELKSLVEGKFVDALRSVASSMTMNDLHEKRTDFVQAVQIAVESDLEKNGLELESVSLTSFDQTDMDFFNADNAFDAQGLTVLTKQIEEKKKERNEIEQDNRLQIAQKNLSTTQKELLIKQEAETSRIETEKQISFQVARQEAEITAIQAEQNRDAQLATVEAEKIAEEAKIKKNRELRVISIEAEKDLETRNIEKEKSLQEARIAQQRVLELAEQDKKIALAEKFEQEAAAQTKAEKARGEQVQATEDVTTISQVAEAERAQKIELINADAAARKDSIQVVVKAEAENKAATELANAKIILAKAEADAEELKAKGAEARYKVEAEGQRLLNEAANLLSNDVIKMTIQKALISVLPDVIRESVKPMEKIESIRVVDMGGASQVGSSGVGGSDGGNGGGSLPDQMVNAALRHRANAPLMDELLGSLGFGASGNVGSMIQSVAADSGLVEKKATPVTEVPVVEATPVAPVVAENPTNDTQLDLGFSEGGRKGKSRKD